MQAEFCGGKHRSYLDEGSLCAQRPIECAERGDFAGVFQERTDATKHLRGLRFAEGHRNSEKLREVGQSFDGIVIVLCTGDESHLKVKVVGGGHGGWSSVEVEGFSVGRCGAIEYGRCENTSEAESARKRAHPKALKFPGVWRNRRGQCAPGNESRRLIGYSRHQAAAALFVVTQRHPVGFLLKGAKAKASGAGLGYDEAAIFKQQLFCLGDGRR